MKGMSMIAEGLPDMYMMHVDEQHFDLIIERDSILAKEGSIDARREANEIDDSDKTSENDVKETAVGPGYMGWQVGEGEEHKNQDFKMLQEAYIDLKRDYKELKEEVTKLREKSDVNINMKH